jgi:hypothetical protein
MWIAFRRMSGGVSAPDLSSCKNSAAKTNARVRSFGIVIFNLRFTHVNIGRDINNLLHDEYFQKSGLPEHHALYDARANLYAYPRFFAAAGQAYPAGQ